YPVRAHLPYRTLFRSCPFIRIRLPGRAQMMTTSDGDTMTQATATERSNQATDKTAIRQFQVNAVPDTELAELRRRINATRWPERSEEHTSELQSPDHP